MCVRASVLLSAVMILDVLSKVQNSVCERVRVSVYRSVEIKFISTDTGQCSKLTLRKNK